MDIAFSEMILYTIYAVGIFMVLFVAFDSWGEK